ncbi:MAG TPA: hypothetical protein VFS24_10665 [Steroidobacteraceae bacterium]|nr:hypothetical protein [Steroidobacteraceae bacterium]
MDKHQQLEALIDKTLRKQPPRRAPESLEANVLAAIEQRMARAWWQSGFARWPIAARVGFALMSVALIRFAMLLGDWVGNGFNSLSSLIANATDWIHPLAHSTTALIERVPPLWLYGGLVVIASAYIMIFGIGMAAYRTLYHAR